MSEVSKMTSEQHNGEEGKETTERWTQTLMTMRSHEVEAHWMRVLQRQAKDDIDADDLQRLSGQQADDVKGQARQLFARINDEAGRVEEEGGRVSVPDLRHALENILRQDS